MRAPTTAPARPRGRRAGVVLLVGGALLAAALAAAPAPPAPLDPSSAEPTGLLGLVRLLRSVGADVRSGGGHPGDATAALLLRDPVADEDGHADLLRWVRAGGVLVVADPASLLLPLATAAPAGGNPSGPGCGLSALDALGPIAADPPLVWGEPVHAYEPAQGWVGCYPVADGHWLVARAEGRGAIVGLGGPWAFSNALLDREDNAVLAAALLAPLPGSAVAVLDLRPPVRAGLYSLLPGRVRAAGAQLVVAFVVLLLWQGRRFGGPFLDDHPVRISGSELVVATGRLWQHSRARGEAAQALRASLQQNLAARTGMSPTTSPAHLAQAAAGWTGTTAQNLQGLLAGPAPASDAALLELAAQTAALRRALTAPATSEDVRDR